MTSPARWPLGGDVARRPLPEHDAAIDELGARERERLGAIWSQRAQSEITAGVVFSEMARGLFADGATAEVQWLAARAVTDEMRHAELCRVLASRYLAREVPFPRPRHVDAPRFGDAPPHVARLLHVVLHSCINETIGAAFLQAGLEDAKGPLVRAVVRELLTDEIDHARLGWAHLASFELGVADRDHVGAALPTLLRIARDLWVNRADDPEGDPPTGHGCLANELIAATAEDTLRDVVLPGFGHAGVAR